MEMKLDYSDISFKNNGKLKLLIIVGTRPEIIRLAAVINKCRTYFDCILAHTGQNYDYNLNGIFFRDLGLADPEVYMNAVGDDLGATVGNIINCSYKLMAQTKPDAMLILGDTNSCLSAIPAKRLHIPIFHMEAGNRCKDECLPEETNRRIVDIISDVNLAYSEHARKYLHDCGLPKERTYVTGSPMAEVLHANLAAIEASDVHERLGLEKGKYILLSAHREENIDTEKNFFSLFTAINAMAEKYDMPILYSCHPRSKKRLEATGFALDKRVIQSTPLGFHDYNCLQMNAFAVVSDGSNPNGNITREQLAVMLWRYAGSPTSDHSLDGYTDADQISGYALEAMRWANETGIITGYGNGLLGAKDNATRAQVAQMLMNFVKSLNP